MFSRQLEMSLVMAIREAKARHHEYVTVEHILYGLLHDKLANNIITTCGGDMQNLKKRLNGLKKMNTSLKLKVLSFLNWKSDH